MFFKRRSRANSYVDNTSDHPPRSQSYDDYDQQQQQQQQQPHVTSPIEDKDAMYSRQSAPQDTYAPPMSSSAPQHHSMPQMATATPPMSTGLKSEPMPDLLAQAFNQAVRPYTEKIEQLQAQVADLQAWVEQLEQQRAEVHSWIDKRGLRPDVPPSIAKIMDSTTSEAALTLNAQLDRKITIVNFDLHRLQDDLNDSISAAHFASAMLKFLPDIERLAVLPGGPRHAFDLVLKLGGNLNSHGGLDSGDPADATARRDFYARLDTAMVDVVSRRFGEGEEWNVQREIKRIEKTAGYLKGFGVEPYFPQTLDVMRRELEFQGRAPAPQSMNGGQNSPPRYH